jgi:DNA-binding transcriptional LysR family regulator
MNLRQLRYFCEVVEAGSAAQAAERLFVAPTAISMQLSQLEEHVGGALFDRSRRPMELTSLGKFFYPRAKELLSQARRLDDEVCGIATGTRGWLGIGFTRSAMFSILPAAIRKFREAFADVHLDLLEVLSEYQPEQLQQRRIDLGISRFIGPFEHLPGMSYTLLLDEPFVAALPAGHPLAEQASISVAEFTALPFILYPKDPRSPFGQQSISILQAAGGEPVIAYEAIEINTALALVGAGLGGSMVGRSIIENNRSDVRFVPFSDLGMSTSVVAVTRKDESSKLVDAFIRTIIA